MSAVEPVFVYFIGTAGSGKSTLAASFKKWMSLRSLDAITVNLDPGAEHLPYEPDVDIRDWISLEEVMEMNELGPNGAQVVCADMIALNTGEVQESIGTFKPDYILMDTPGHSGQFFESAVRLAQVTYQFKAEKLISLSQVLNKDQTFPPGSNVSDTLISTK